MACPFGKRKAQHFSSAAEWEKLLFATNQIGGAVALKSRTEAFLCSLAKDEV